jgi:hypothetical protein
VRQNRLLRRQRVGNGAERFAHAEKHCIAPAIFFVMPPESRQDGGLPRSLAAPRFLQTVNLGAGSCGEPFPLSRTQDRNKEMKGQATKLQAAEDELKQLMADVTRAMEKAQDAVARITRKSADAAAETEAVSSS